VARREGATNSPLKKKDQMGKEGAALSGTMKKFTSKRTAGHTQENPQTKEGDNFKSLSSVRNSKA